VNILPELPHQKVERFEKEYQITHYDASVLASEQALADFYEAAAVGSSAPKKVGELGDQQSPCGLE
jgi:aspartyl-tRNA(Asn)/glutamyl-tRNA(Gln) amidotransferase subunit B